MPSKWYTVFVRDLTRQWVKVAEIQSPGLTNYLLIPLQKLYGIENVRTTEGRHARPPESLFI